VLLFHSIDQFLSLARVYLLGQEDEVLLSFLLLAAEGVPLVGEAGTRVSAESGHRRVADNDGVVVHS